MNNETWKEIVWFTKYQISSSWKIKSTYFWKERIMKDEYNSCWYLIVRLYSWWISKKKLIHRLVAEHFIENPENKKEVNHKDWNILNNNDWNLEWCTRQENMMHSHYKLWTESYKKRVKVSQFKDWIFIRSFRSIWEASRETWINSSNICQHLKWNKFYSHVQWFTFQKIWLE